GTKECVETVDHEEDADRDTHVAGIRPDQQHYAGGNAECRARDEGPELPPVQGAPQFPNRVALHEKAKGDDQGRTLRWREDVKPERCRDETEGKPGQARNEGDGQSGQQTTGTVKRV